MTGKKREPADPAGLPALSIALQPFTGHSVVTVVISHREGSTRVDRRLARWHVPLTRSDLAGRTTDDVLITVLGVVLHRVKQHANAIPNAIYGDPADHTAVGPGAPASGATGAVQYPLPGDWPTPGTPGGVDPG